MCTKSLLITRKDSNPIDRVRENNTCYKIYILTYTYPVCSVYIRKDNKMSTDPKHTSVTGKQLNAKLDKAKTKSIHFQEKKQTKSFQADS